jgi:hypothetical protein
VLLTNLECYQFIKLPVLIEHFREHRENNPQMTFWAYWNLHYKGHPKDADYNRDQQLPFQTSDAIQVISSSGFILPQIYSFSFSLELINHSIFTYYPGFIPEYCSTDIFQPPRLA